MLRKRIILAAAMLGEARVSLNSPQLFLPGFGVAGISLPAHCLSLRRGEGRVLQWTTRSISKQCGIGALTLSTHLRNAWGVPFHVHMHHSDSWLPLSDDAEEADPNLLEAAQAMVAPLVTTENEETTIAIRLHAPSARPAAAVAVVPKRSDELVTVFGAPVADAC